jgi:hypothetical protein
MVYVFVVVVDAATLAPAVVAALGDFAALGDLLAAGGLLAAGVLLDALAVGVLVPAEWALALTAREQENPVRPSVTRTAMIPAIFRITLRPVLRSLAGSHWSAGMPQTPPRQHRVPRLSARFLSVSVTGHPDASWSPSVTRWPRAGESAVR